MNKYLGLKIADLADVELKDINESDLEELNRLCKRITNRWDLVRRKKQGKPRVYKKKAAEQ